MNNVAVIIEQSQDPWSTPTKIANTFLNRFTVDEDDACEVITVLDETREPFEFDIALKSNNLHLIIAGEYFHNRLNQIRNNAWKWMKNSNIESITVSLLRMTRACLMTQTEMSEALKLEFMPDTVNDDLDAFVEKLRFGNASEEEIFTYHFYELSEAENTPVQNDASWTILDDLKYLETVQKSLLNSSKNMLFDSSEIKWAKVCCWRSTFLIENKPVLKSAAIKKLQFISESQPSHEHDAKPAHQVTDVVDRTRKNIWLQHLKPKRTVFIFAVAPYAKILLKFSTINNISAKFTDQSIM